MQSLGFASTEGAKVFLSRLPSHLFGVTAEPSDTSGQAPLRAAGALPPADLRLQGGLFQSLVSLTVRGRESAFRLRVAARGVPRGPAAGDNGRIGHRGSCLSPGILAGS